MTAEKLFHTLNKGCQGGMAAIRSVVTLQPADGAGGKAFPPTYAGGAYAFEKRIINSTRVDCVLLDSIQSQANRFEEALFEAYRSKRLSMPMFEMNVGGHEITTLNVPH